MLVQFKQAAHVCGKDYGKGVHEIPDAVMQDKYFHKLVGLGLVVEAEKPKIISPESEVEKQKQFQERLLTKAQMTSIKEEESAAPAQIETAVEQQDEEKEKSKKSKRKG